MYQRLIEDAKEATGVAKGQNNKQFFFTLRFNELCYVFSDQKYKYPSAANMFLPKKSADIFNQELQLMSKLKFHQV